MKTPLLLTLLLFSAAPPASAATRTWDGGGAADNFNAAANWNPDGVPVNDDDLVFPAAAPATVNNDLTGRTFGSITIQRGGFTLTGNAFTLTGGITTSPGITGGAVVIGTGSTSAPTRHSAAECSVR